MTSLRASLAGLLSLLVFLSSSPSANADLPIETNFNYATDKIRGVNIGGWLVLEPWITPSVFDDTGNDNVVDEWTLGQYGYCSVLENHWDTFYTEADFAYISQAGLNHVRIPIGYWAFDVSYGEPYCQGQLPYLQQAVQWAEQYDLNVLIDLHGAPGSQNGFDNSGRRLPYPEWQSNTSNIERTKAVLTQIVDMFAAESAFVAVEGLNEPAGYYPDVLTPLSQFYYDFYGNARYPFGSEQSNILVVLHDAFQPGSYWSGFMPASNWQGVILDTHIYQVFTDADVAMTYAEHISAACNAASGLSASGLWTMVGEWSTSPNDCATYLNGRGVGSRYDGTYSGSSYVGSCTGLTGSASTFSTEYKQFLRQYWEAQVAAYEQANGWMYWTWKTESTDEWSYFALLQYEILSWDVTERLYGNQCNF